MHYRSLSETARLLQTKAISPVELTRHMLDRVAAVDRNLKSYVTVMADRALDAARRAEAEIQSGRYRGPLHGMPIGMKDLCYTRGVATAPGTKIYSGYRSGLRRDGRDEAAGRRRGHSRQADAL